MKALRNGTKCLPYITVVVAVAVSVCAVIAETTTGEMVLSNPGSAINSAGDDFYPTITSDGSTMVFSMRPENDESSDIFISTLADGVWTKARPIREINSKLDEQTPFISSDGKVLLFSSNREGSLRPPHKGGGVYYLTNDIYVSHKTESGWSSPQRLQGDVNTVDNERAPSMSRDGKTLYFSRYSGNDIYSSKIYSAEINGVSTGNVAPLPQPINSEYSEFALMPSSDKPGFYFSSSRPEGLGLWDIYFVSFINNEYGIPVNLGEPVNSEFNDLSITEIGKTIFFCSDRDGGAGKSDIYTIAISRKVFQLPDTGFKLYVVDKKTRNAVSTKLDVSVVRDAGEGGGQEKNYTVESDGNGIGEVKTGHSATSVTVKAAEGRYRQEAVKLIPSPGEMKSVIIELEEAAEKKEISRPVVSGAAPAMDFRIGPIYFDYRSSSLSEKERKHVRKIYNVLKNEPDLCVKIAGHTDPRGSDSYNMKLGYARAVAVKNALVKSGLKNAKYSVVSMGERRPSYLAGKTGRQEFNRRVIVSVVEGAGGKRGR
ncbi:MAG: hypothetical protein C4529_02910 [Deltaproteobacteria bacterium]|nr:MAG: hypothetical protein C4529_02910 [Deltaproteobacteria bacterium]